MRYLKLACVTCLLASGVALAQATPPPEQKAASSPAADSGDGKAAAYYHYSLGHLYAEMAGAFGNRGEYFTKAAENFRLAMKEDPEPLSSRKSCPICTSSRAGCATR